MPIGGGGGGREPVPELSLHAPGYETWSPSRIQERERGLPSTAMRLFFCRNKLQSTCVRFLLAAMVGALLCGVVIGFVMQAAAAQRRVAAGRDPQGVHLVGERARRWSWGCRGPAGAACRCAVAG